MDGMIDVVDALVIRRNDAEGMRSGLVLARRDDLALRERGWQASLIGDERQICRLVESNSNSPTGHRQRVAQTAAEIPPRRANRVSPGGMQRSIDANKLLVFDSIARHAAPLGVQQVPVCSTSEGSCQDDSAGSMPERAGSDKGALSTAIRAVRVTLPSSESSSDKAMAFRFVHTADVHLDSPLATLALRDPQLADLIGGATRKAFVAVIDLCLSEQADALLIAGDLYDGEQTSMKTARFLADQMRRLDEAGIATFLIRGNHDAESRITRELTLPESVKVFVGRAEAASFRRGGLEATVHGVSFAHKHAPESLLPKFRTPVPGTVNIGMLHTSLGGSSAHGLYAPCALADLHGAGFDYWALGHIHQRFEERGRAAIVMPGNPQGRDINEAGPKSATLVAISDDRKITTEERLTSVAQFERLRVDLAGVDDRREALARIEKGLLTARAAAASEHLVARLRLVGATPLAWRLRSDANMLAEECRSLGAAIGKIWIDKIELDCVAPRAEERAPPSDPVGELRALMETEVAQSKAFQDALGEIAEELRRNLPQSARDDLLGQDPGELAKILRALAREGAEDVLAHLRAGDRDVAA
jgi:DNA repair protein SbcD/Mre11